MQENDINDGEQIRPPAWWRHLWVSYRNPFNLLLTVLAAMSLLTGDVQGALVIAFMVVLATLIHFFQERRSNQAAQALKERVSRSEEHTSELQSRGHLVC